MPMRESVAAAIAAAETDPRDQGAVDLALAYAADIDAGEGDLAKLGPALLAVLEALGLSPRARKAVKTSEQPAANPLDQLAAVRARKSRADDGHAAAT